MSCVFASVLDALRRYRTHLASTMGPLRLDSGGRERPFLSENIVVNDIGIGVYVLIASIAGVLVTVVTGKMLRNHSASTGPAAVAISVCGGALAFLALAQGVTSSSADALGSSAVESNLINGSTDPRRSVALLLLFLALLVALLWRGTRQLTKPGSCRQPRAAVRSPFKNVRVASTPGNGEGSRVRPGTPGFGEGRLRSGPNPRASTGGRTDADTQ